LIPVSLISVLKNFDSKNINISKDEQNLYFQSDDVCLVARRLAKSFPEYDKIVPKTFQFRVKFKVEELRGALRRLAPLLEPENQKICLTFTGESAIISLNNSMGSGEDVIGYEFLEPDPLFDDLNFVVTVNHSFMQDFTEAVSGELVFAANGENDPIVLESGNKKLLMAAMKG
jgi:DNA polymerase III sliding clamp (beta) subunit (PCNA family)